MTKTMKLSKIPLTTDSNNQCILVKLTPELSETLDRYNLEEEEIDDEGIEVGRISIKPRSGIISIINPLDDQNSDEDFKFKIKNKEPRVHYDIYESSNGEFRSIGGVAKKMTIESLNSDQRREYYGAKTKALREESRRLKANKLGEDETMREAEVGGDTGGGGFVLRSSSKKRRRSQNINQQQSQQQINEEEELIDIPESFTQHSLSKRLNSLKKSLVSSPSSRNSNKMSRRKVGNSKLKIVSPHLVLCNIPTCATGKDIDGFVQTVLDFDEDGDNKRLSSSIFSSSNLFQNEESEGANKNSYQLLIPLVQEFFVNSYNQNPHVTSLIIEFSSVYSTEEFLKAFYSIQTLKENNFQMLIEGLRDDRNICSLYCQELEEEEEINKEMEEMKNNIFQGLWENFHLIPLSLESLNDWLFTEDDIEMKKGKKRRRKNQWLPQLPIFHSIKCLLDNTEDEIKDEEEEVVELDDQKSSNQLFISWYELLRKYSPKNKSIIEQRVIDILERFHFQIPPRSDIQLSDLLSNVVSCLTSSFLGSEVTFKIPSLNFWFHLIVQSEEHLSISISEEFKKERTKEEVEEKDDGINYLIMEWKSISESTLQLMTHLRISPESRMSKMLMPYVQSVHNLSESFYSSVYSLPPISPPMPGKPRFITEKSVSRGVIDSFGNSKTPI